MVQKVARQVSRKDVVDPTIATSSETTPDGGPIVWERELAVIPSKVEESRSLQKVKGVARRPRKGWLSQAL